MARAHHLGRRDAAPNEIRASFGAQFVEVWIHERTREIHVARVLGAYAAGTIINPITAKAGSWAE